MPKWMSWEQATELAQEIRTATKCEVSVVAASRDIVAATIGCSDADYICVLHDVLQDRHILTVQEWERIKQEEENL